MSARAIPTKIPAEICRSGSSCLATIGEMPDGVDAFFPWSALKALRALRAKVAGTAVTAKSRRDLLAALAAGEVVELEIDITAFHQVDGDPNENFLRFKPGILRKFAKSFTGQPFLRDHDGPHSASRAGTVKSSSAEPINGGLAFEMTVAVTEPGAVADVLRGLLDRFSIAWFPPPIETVLCSIDNTPVFTACTHFPGELAKDEDGNELGRVEFVMTEARGSEVSGINIPAATGTGIQEIRAALSATAPKDTKPTPPTKVKRMSLSKLALSLGLAADADEGTIQAAVDANRAALAASQSAAGQQAEQLTALKAQVDVITERETAAKIDKLFADNADRMPPARDASGNAIRSPFEVQLRALAARDYSAAEQLVLTAQPHTPADVPPIVQPIALGRAVPSPTDIHAVVKHQCKQLRMTPEQYAKFNPVNGTELDAADDPVSFKPRLWGA